MIRLERLAYLPNCTIGRLLYGDQSLATIEKQWEDNKPFISCIPEGMYICKQYSSTKYPNTYEITNIHGRSHILFHPANWARELQGCIALGTALSSTEFKINNSRMGTERFMEYLNGRSQFDLLITQYSPEYRK